MKTNYMVSLIRLFPFVNKKIMKQDALCLGRVNKNRRVLFFCFGLSRLSILCYNGETKYRFIPAKKSDNRRKASVKIRAIKYGDVKDYGLEHFNQWYDGKEGVILRERKSIMDSSDHSAGSWERVSRDNGRTFGEWVKDEEYHTSAFQGENERQIWGGKAAVWNHVHKHYVRLFLDTIWQGGHEKAYAALWGKSDPSLFAQHSYLGVRLEGEEERIQLVRYEEGAEFDPENWCDSAFFQYNKSHPNLRLIVEENGDILFALSASIRTCCKMAGKDVEAIYPSYPDQPHAIMIIRGIFDGEKYRFEPGRPIVISDILSSRGLTEPAIARLESGRIVVVMRGSNTFPKAWDKKRINPHTPGFKWFSYSDDNGKTFTDPMPWFFENGEAVYSSATISHIVKSEKNGKHYWIGNLTPPETIDGNYPRWPLNIMEIDETYGFGKKETIQVIDTVREGESDQVQLSNFSILQNRETKNIELMLTKVGQFRFKPEDTHFKGEAWKYEIDVE